MGNGSCATRGAAEEAPADEQVTYPGIYLAGGYNRLWLNPVLPHEISCIQTRLRYRSHWLSLEISHQKLIISIDNGWANNCG